MYPKYQLDYVDHLDPSTGQFHDDDGKQIETCQEESVNQRKEWKRVDKFSSFHLLAGRRTRIENAYRLQISDLIRDPGLHQ